MILHEVFSLRGLQVREYVERFFFNLTLNLNLHLLLYILYLLCRLEWVNSFQLWFCSVSSFKLASSLAVLLPALFFSWRSWNVLASIMVVMCFLNWRFILYVNLHFLMCWLSSHHILLRWRVRLFQAALLRALVLLLLPAEPNWLRWYLIVDLKWFERTGRSNCLRFSLLFFNLCLFRLWKCHLSIFNFNVSRGFHDLVCFLI